MTRAFQNVDVALPALASAIMNDGAEVGSRLGERTLELLHEQIMLTEPRRREVLVKDRGANIVAQIAETMWVLAGRNDVEWLGHYLPRAKDFSDDGLTWRGGYGPRLRFFGAYQQDQIKHVLDVLSEDRSSRRAVASIYDANIDTTPGKDIPCNDFLSFINRNGRLDLSVFVRSNDLIWGWSGINQFEWSALQEIVAGILGVEVGNLVFNTTSLHIYDRHWEKARRLEELSVSRGFADSPRFSGSAVHNHGSADQHPVDRLDDLISQWFQVEEALRTGGTVPPADVLWFPEPMMRSWLQVIAWYWTGDGEYLASIEGTRLWAAVQMSPASVSRHAEGRKTPEHTIVEEKSDSGMDPRFVNYVDSLHREKGAAYGDSWKKRGEQMSILANIARKVDRLGGGVDTSDETQADTAVDLLVYLCKYRLWLSETNPDLSLPMLHAGDEYDDLRAALEWLSEAPIMDKPEEYHLEVIYDRFYALEREVTRTPHREDDTARVRILNALIPSAFFVASSRWLAANPDFQNPYRNIDG